MGSKSPSPDKGWVGDEGVEVSTRVPSDSSDVVSSGEDWEESESESCGKVLLSVSDCLGFWSASLTNKAWVVFHI